VELWVELTTDSAHVQYVKTAISDDHGFTIEPGELSLAVTEE
jgi:hypothetical protein